MGTKVLASLTVLIGSVGVIYALLAAFGVELSQNQQTAVSGAAALVVTLAGLWLHPSIPLGETPPK